MTSYLATEHSLTPPGSYIDYLMLCDAAQVVQGKLYVMGGGWDRAPRFVSGEPGRPVPPTTFALAVGLLVDWNDTNRPLNVRVAIEEIDEAPPLFEMKAQVMVGRPPDAPPGNPLRHLVAFPVAVIFPAARTYCVRGTVDDAPPTVVRFHVRDHLISSPPVS